MTIYWIGLIALGALFLLQLLTKDMLSGFLTRLLSGVILVLIALLTIGRGGNVLFLTALLLSEAAMLEYLRAVGIRQEGAPQELELVGYIGIVVYYFGLRFLPENAFWLGILVVLMLLLSFFVARFPKYDVTEILTIFFGVVYTGVMLSCVYLLRALDSGRLHVWLVFLAAWGSDTFAYCAGMLWGKHPMTPVLSPKKTWEGFGGGLAGAAILGAVYGALTHGPVLVYLLITLCGAAISVVGDLAASAIKRQRGIKDYGELIPGHGGILDRFDSMIFTAPIVYLLCLVLIR